MLSRAGKSKGNYHALRSTTSCRTFSRIVCQFPVEKLGELKSLRLGLAPPTRYPSEVVLLSDNVASVVVRDHETFALQVCRTFSSLLRRKPIQGDHTASKQVPSFQYYSM